MATSQVQGRLLYAWTRPMSSYLLPKPSPFNRQVFFFTPNPLRRALQALSNKVKFRLNLRPKSWPNKKTIQKCQSPSSNVSHFPLRHYINNNNQKKKKNQLQWTSPKHYSNIDLRMTETLIALNITMNYKPTTNTN